MSSSVKPTVARRRTRFTIAIDGTAADNVENLVFARTLAADAVDGKGKVVAEAGSDIGRQTIKDFIAAGVAALVVRSPLTSRIDSGCAWRVLRPFRWRRVRPSISEKQSASSLPSRLVNLEPSSRCVPSTRVVRRRQRTSRRVFPGVAELFEARTPKGASPIADATGRVAIDESGAQRKLILTPDNGDDAYSYTILKNAVLLVEDGSHVEVGTQLFVGTLDPKDVLRVRGLREVQTDLVEGVQGVYLPQGVPIHDSTSRS